MGVDEAGCYVAAGTVDRPDADGVRAGSGAHGPHDAVADEDVGDHSGGSEPIEDGAAAQHQWFTIHPPSVSDRSRAAP
jgi:hypothetical protein